MSEAMASTEANEATPSVHIEVDGRTATVTLDRPPVNVLDLAMIGELDRIFSALALEAEISTVVVRGATPKAFSAGVAVQDHTPDKVEEMLHKLHGAIRKLRDLDAVTIAAVSGHCLGGGMEVALGCDWVVADETARFGQPEIKLGCYPPVAAALYPQIVGAARTLELLITGRTLDIDEAEKLGFVTFRALEGKLDAKLAQVLSAIDEQSAAVVRLTKRAVRMGRDLPFTEALDATERLYLDELCHTEDMAEGLQAFLDKRAPSWRHR